MKYLCDLEVGQSCIVSEILTRGSMRRRFLDIGLIENTVVKCVGQSPSGIGRASCRERV